MPLQIRNLATQQGQKRIGIGEGQVLQSYPECFCALCTHAGKIQFPFLPSRPHNSRELSRKMIIYERKYTLEVNWLWAAASA